MRRFIVLALCALPLFIGCAQFPESVAGACPSPAALEAEAPMQIAQGRTLCCCATYSGGSCCNYVAFCGSFVPGCSCRY